jgi:integrase
MSEKVEVRSKGSSPASKGIFGKKRIYGESSQDTEPLCPSKELRPKLSVSVASQTSDKIEQPVEATINLPRTCPNCMSQIFFNKNGIRYLKDGTAKQRWLCKKCGYRFSEHTSVRETNFLSNSAGAINSQNCLNTECQICALEAKNLTSATKTEVAGESPQQDLKGKIVEFTFWMKKQGYKEATYLARTKLLKIMTRREANLYDPETVKTTIAKQQWSEGRKANAVDAYSSWLKMTGGKWDPPRYHGVHKIPFIPTESEIDQVISGCSNRMATFVQFLKETGARSGEAWQEKWTDIDYATKTVSITPEKNSNPRIIHISPKLMSMLETLPKNYGERIFSNPQQPLDHYRDIFCQQRKRIAYKLQNPRILRIKFHTLRHWKGTMEYHKTKDILHVKQLLGHKRIENTLMYVQLAEELFKDEIGYVSKVAKTEAEACVLIDNGFDFVCDFEGHKLFRKKKF